MRRYLKISLLLLLLNFLFLLDVHALENNELDNSFDAISQVVQSIEDNQDETPQVENSLSGDDLIQLIPDQFDLNYTEEDAICLFDDNADLDVLIDLKNQIQTIFDDNHILLDELGVDFTVTRLFYQEDTEYTIYQYRVIIHGFGEEIMKDISVTYSNTSDYNLEDEELVKNAFSEEEELEIDNSYDFFTGEAIQEEEIFDQLEEKLPGVNYSFFYEQTSQEDNELSVIQTGHTYLFINKVFYRIIPTILRFYYQMNVSPDISNQDIVQEVSEKLEELQVEISDGNIMVTNEGDVYLGDKETYYGNIDIERIKKEDKKEYSFIEGSNKTIIGSGQLVLKLDCLMKKFIKLIIDGKEVNKNNYSIINNQIIVSNNFISSVQKGNHSLIVRFSDGDGKTSFTLKDEERVEPQQEEYYYPYYVEYEYEPVKKEEALVLKEEKKEEEKKEEKSVLSPSDVVKDNEYSEERIEEKIDEGNSNFNLNIIPIVIVILAFIFGGFGGYLYKKSLED